MAIAAGVLLALQALPALLRPPEPPPLAPDVGLPAVVPQRPEPTTPPPHELHQIPHLPGRNFDAVRKRDPRRAVISSRPRRHRRPPAPPPRPWPEPAPPAAPAPPSALPAPPPTPESVAAPSPAPAPPPPPPADDGSEEF